MLSDGVDFFRDFFYTSRIQCIIVSSVNSLCPFLYDRRECVAGTFILYLYII